MAQPLSYESSDLVFFITTRTIASRLWLIHNRALEKAILSYLAKYQKVYNVVLYGFILMGNHYHMLAKFPQANRAKFMRAFNAIVAKLTARYVPNFVQGKLWARRYAFQAVPRNEDILHWFLYLTLNPVTTGLCEHPDQYPSYNSYSDSANGIVRKYKVFDWAAYNEQKRFNANIDPQGFEKEYELIYSRLPGFEEENQSEYKSTLDSLSKNRREELVNDKLSKGWKFQNRNNLISTLVGAQPKNTKKSERNSRRPLVLTLCKMTRASFLKWYFALLREFRTVSYQFLRGDKQALFPFGTYPPCAIAIS